jgi:hypothetical protein
LILAVTPSPPEQLEREVLASSVFAGGKLQLDTRIQKTANMTNTVGGTFVIMFLKPFALSLNERLEPQRPKLFPKTTGGSDDDKEAPNARINRRAINLKFKNLAHCESG